MGEDPQGSGPVGVYDRRGRAIPAWVWVIAVMLALLAVAWWLM